MGKWIKGKGAASLIKVTYAVGSDENNITSPYRNRGGMHESLYTLLKSFTKREKNSGSNSFFISFCMTASAWKDDFGER